MSNENDGNALPPGWPRFLSDDEFLVIRDHFKRQGGITAEEGMRVQEDRLARCLRGIATLRGLGTLDAVTDAGFLEQAVRHMFKSYFKLLERESGLKNDPKITPEAYRAAWEKSRTGTVADVARRMKVHRSNLSTWLSEHPEHRLPKK